MTYSNEQLHRAFSDEFHAHKQTKENVKRLTLALAQERHSNKVKSFILKHFKSDIDTIDRCLNKATTIVLENDMICVMNEEWIFYFGSARNTTFSRKEYKFMLKFDFKGKKLQANNIKAYKNHVKLVNNVHIWV